MPRGDPTELVRLPTRLVDRYRKLAEEQGVPLTAVIARKLEPPRRPVPARGGRRCECKVPKLSANAPICTTCHLPR